MLQLCVLNALIAAVFSIAISMRLSLSGMVLGWPMGRAWVFAMCMFALAVMKHCMVSCFSSRSHTYDSRKAGSRMSTKTAEAKFYDIGARFKWVERQ